MTFSSSARRTVRSLFLRSSHASRTADAPEPGAAPAAGRRRALRIGALSTALLLLGGGSIATASAHKTVTLDVDGELTEISTFSGSVAGVLATEGVAVGDRDLVAPAVTDGLRDGDEIVVRTAHPLVIERDGDQTTVWTTELSADDALLALTARGEDVRLLASRSADTGRADLALRLDLDGPVDVVADGETHEVTDGSVGLEEVLASLDITLSDLDRVHVELAGDARERLTVVVQRVVVEERAALSEVPFESVTEPSAELYTGQRATAVAGIAGERTTVHRVVLVDGAEESRRLLSDDVTRAPVTEVIHEGAKVRPAPAPRATSGGSTGAVASTVGGDVWAALAQCESGGNPTIVSSNGLYHGLYQFSVSTWQSVGGVGLPSEASPAEQTLRAQILQARSGWGQWPACSLKLGLR